MESPSPKGSRSSSVRLILVAAGLVLAAVLLIQQVTRLFADRTIMPPDDFVEYWAAGRLNAHGENPYDGAKLLALEKTAGRATFPVDSSGNDVAIMMWNPPWTLTIVMPIGLLESRLAQLLWLLVHLGVIVFCADWTWGYYQGPPIYRWLSWVLALSFIPSMMVLRAGQIGPLILLGVVGFLHFEKTGRLFLAGAACVLIAIKPHLLFLFWIALAVWAVEQRRWMVLIGGTITGLVATAIPILCNPSVCHQYWYALTHRPPEEWVSLTIGSILRLLFGQDKFWLQFVPALPALVWFGFHWRKHHADWGWSEQMPLLVLVSFLTAVYGAWPFDLVILLLPVVQAGVWTVADRRLRAPGLVIYLAINVLALSLHLAGVTSICFIWMSPALLAGYLSLRAWKA